MMASTTTSTPATPTSSTKPKKFICSFEGCAKGFTRSDHLQRHVLNHSTGNSTCPRCSLHFKRPDLLDRHMARHRQKDEEAGGEGLGVVETRKKLWRDADGNIVSKRPAPSESEGEGQNPSQRSDGERDGRRPASKKHAVDPSGTTAMATTALHAEPLSPPGSLRSAAESSSFDQHQQHQLPELPDDQEGFMDPMTATTAGQDMFDFLANSSWGSQTSSTLNMPGSAENMPFDDMFNPDTASSFNMPFTTMNNYNWLFDLGDSGERQMPPATTMASTQQTNFTSLLSDSQHSTMREAPPVQQTHPSQSPSISHNGAFATNLNQPSYRQPTTILQQQQQPYQQQPFPVSDMYPFNSAGSDQHEDDNDAAMLATVSPSSIDSSLMGGGSSAGNTSSTSQTSTHSDLAPRLDIQPIKPSMPASAQGRHNMTNLTHVQMPPSQSSFHIMQALPPTQSRRNMPTMDEVSRNQILDLIVFARPRTPEGLEISRDHPLLSLSSMQNYLDLFFSRFNVAYPLLHQATFDPSQTEPLLLLAVLLLGATYSCEKAIHRLAVCIHDIMRAQIFQHAAFTASPELWMLQTILLVECFGKSRAGQKQHDMAHLFHGLLINLIRRSDCQTVRQPNFGQGSGDLESDWRRAIDVELRKRLAFLCFLWDTQHAVLFSQSLCMSSFELRTTLPCNQTTWEAGSAEEWWKYARKEPQISYLSVLKCYMNPDAGTGSIPPLNALSRLLVLHGLMSVQWDMKRRDQTSMGVGSLADQQPRWQDRLAQSYDAWKADFDTYCMNMTLSLSLGDDPSRKAEFVRFSTATNAIYHAAHITLNVEILDLQIYAGARHIIGRPVTRADYDRSRRVVKEWATATATPASTTASTHGGTSTPAAKAAWHAAHLLRDGILNLDNWDVNNAFHYPWCLYLATLTCWAFHFANVVDKSGGMCGNGTASTSGNNNYSNNTINSINADHFVSSGNSLLDSGVLDDGMVWHAKSEMNALVSSMTSVVPENLWRGLGKYSTSGLTAVMAKHLSNIRWAVVHEGMKVLRGLVPERSINEYETLLK